MLAVVVDKFSPVGSIDIRSVEEPSVPDGHALIDVAATGLGFVDGLKVAGLYQTKDPLPFIPGMEFSGVISRVGTGAERLKVGDRVFGQAPRGALAERISVPAIQLLRMSEHTSFAQAAAVPVNYLTALYGLRERASLRPGELLLILGAAGGTGTAAIKVGKMLGAEIIAAASTEEKRAFALAEGASLAINPAQPQWRDELKALTNGRTVDVIYDVVGGDISPIAFRTLGWRGRHLAVGFAAGAIPTLTFNIPLLKGASLIGVDSAQIQKREPDMYVRLMSEIESALATGKLEPPPVQTFAFDQFQHAFEAMASRRAAGKVVVMSSSPSAAAQNTDRSAYRT